MTRTDHLEQLDGGTCLELLASQVVGRVAFVLDGRPNILPVNYVVDGWTIAFRTDFGEKLIAANAGDYVAFEADSHDRASRVGWSVVARGVAEAVHDDEVAAGLEALDLDTWAGSARHVWVRIHLEELTGRRLEPQAALREGRAARQGALGSRRAGPTPLGRPPRRAGAP